MLSKNKFLTISRMLVNYQAKKKLNESSQNPRRKNKIFCPQNRENKFHWGKHPNERVRRRDEREFEVEQDDDQIAHFKILIKLSSGGIKLDTQWTSLRSSENTPQKIIVLCAMFKSPLLTIYISAIIIAITPRIVSSEHCSSAMDIKVKKNVRERDILF